MPSEYITEAIVAEYLERIDVPFANTEPDDLLFNDEPRTYPQFHLHGGLKLSVDPDGTCFLYDAVLPADEEEVEEIRDKLRECNNFQEVTDAQLEDCVMMAVCLGKLDRERFEHLLKVFGWDGAKHAN